MDRSVIHINVADFAATVETLLNPRLKGYPLVIAPLGAPRAVVYDMSDTAFREGIRKGMPLARARRLHKGIAVLPPRFNRYEGVMKQMVNTGRKFAPAVEYGLRDGHLFLDVTGTGRLFGPAPDVAFRLRNQLQKQAGLDPIWSVAPNKLTAKVATRLVKPLGEYIVGPGEAADFLAPLPVSLIPGLDREEVEILAGFNLVCVSQVRQLTLGQLAVPFQGRARAVHDLVRGIDPEPVADALPFRLQASREFSDDTNDQGLIHSALYGVVQDLATRLRKYQRRAKTIAIRLSYSDGIEHHGQKRLDPPTAWDGDLFSAARDLLHQTWRRRVRIRHLTLSCRKAVTCARQALLFDDATGAEEKRRLAETLDRVRVRFGPGAVQSATALAGAAG